MSVIVNADDFGISEEVNNAIRLAFERGLIGRTTLMVNMPYAEQAMDIARECGFIDSVGLHLNLTAGIPLYDPMSSDPVMCDMQGKFTADFARNLKTRFFLPKSTTVNVENELKAQLKRYEELGGVLWHLDSHHHVHTNPSVWRPLRKAMKACPVRSIRLGRNMYKGGNPLMHLYKSILNASIKNHCKIKEDYFGSYDDYENWTKELSAAQKNDFTQNYEVEIMVHPMFSEEGILMDSDRIFEGQQL